LGDIVNTLNRFGANHGVGIYSSRYEWTTVFGSRNYCSNFTNLPVWFSRYNDKETLNDFLSFAGWTSAAGK